MSNLAEGPHGFKRSLFHRRHLVEYPLLVQFLRHVLVYGCSDNKPKFNKELNECYRRGWLHAESLSTEQTVYVFPTKLHQR